MGVVLIAIAAIIAVASLHRFSFFFDLVSVERISHLVDLARHERVYTAGFYLLFTLGVMILPITLFPIVGGVLLRFEAALLLNLIAATMGAWLSFVVSRLVGRHAVEKLFRGKIRSIDKVTATQGFKTVFLLRFVGVPPFIVANYALGLSKVKHQDFLMGTFFGILPWMGLITYASHSLWNAVLIGGEEGLMKAMFHAVGPLMLLSTTTMVLLAINYVLKKRKEKREKKPVHPAPHPTHTGHSNL